MKNKLLYLIAFVLVTPVGVRAQESGSVMVNINLHPIHIIKVNPSQTTVQIEYMTESDYREGVTSLQSGHLSVFSTSAFEVTARSVDPLLYANHEGQGIALSSLQIAALSPSGLKGELQSGWVQLSQGPESILSSISGAAQTSVDILYKGAGNNAFIEKIDSAKEKNLFSTKIIYSVETK